jgi:hypothetical protein
MQSVLPPYIGVISSFILGQLASGILEGQKCDFISDGDFSLVFVGVR